MDLKEWNQEFPTYSNTNDFNAMFLKDYYKMFSKNHNITLGVFLYNCLENSSTEFVNGKEGESLTEDDAYEYLNLFDQITNELYRYNAYQHERLANLDDINSKIEAIKKPKAREQTVFNLPEKIAILYELGIIKELERFPVKEDRYRVVHSLIGGDLDNIKKYMSNKLSHENIRVAQHFINSKKI